MKVNREA